ncbi:glycosyltransferase [Limimaricola hongkongensis]|uniref:Glycosyltransferase n=1 Tax=Limimaricola hongkongensis DSM 17492 TaxID=1122180 RepID=A0A017H7Q4_9RHOB|nr:hypothetical protein [Limimaricola hongkongensis]EYD70345.1 glycosyltransferase [Limimaricola hongkongensis DSM 17492]
MRAADFDIIVVGDARFQGGTTAAMAADVAAFSRLGARIGLLFVRSPFLEDDEDPPNPAALELADLDGVHLLAPGQPAQARLAFLHHPMVFFRGIETRSPLRADQSVLVAHHPPFRADGSLEYDPVTTARRARAALGLSVRFGPISGTVRRQLESFAPFIRLTGEDWPNIFDTGRWSRGPEILTGPGAVIGRHGRADLLKWPATAAEIDACLPASDALRVRVLGCPQSDLRARGARLDGWEVVEFGAEDPSAFLHSLDIFAYHYHPNWVEGFGRTVIEAALSGRPCLLDPRLEPTFGPMALYCPATEVAAAVERMLSDRTGTRRRAIEAREIAQRRFGTDSLRPRLAALQNDPGTRARRAASIPPTVALRKLAGLYRRRTAGLEG